MATQASIALKRAYEQPSPSDGIRLLVDRLWPRGLKKQEAKIDRWLRDLAPSDGLRKWFHERRVEWPEFRRRYLRELRLPTAAAALEELYSYLGEQDRLTLIFSSADQEHNNAVVLKELIEGMRKPPAGTTSKAARGLRERRARRRG